MFDRARNSLHPRVRPLTHALSTPHHLSHMHRNKTSSEIITCQDSAKLVDLALGPREMGPCSPTGARIGCHAEREELG